MKKIKNYFWAILIPVLIGIIVGILINSKLDYNNLIKPPFAPPSILFPIVWSILYVLMGISYGILKNDQLNNSKIKFIYYFQLFINALWSIFFFLLKWRLFSIFWIIILDITVLIMILEMIKSKKIAGLLQLPYFFWLIFATYLNISIYYLN